MPVPENFSPLEWALIRALVPAAAGIGAAGLGAPVSVRYLAPAIASGGLTAYESPEGEGLTRAVAHTGGTLLGGLAGGALHDAALKPLLRDAAVSEFRGGPSGSTLGGRLALMGWSDDGQLMARIMGAMAGNRAGRSLADAVLAHRDAGMAGETKTAGVGSFIAENAGKVWRGGKAVLSKVPWRTVGAVYGAGDSLMNDTKKDQRPGWHRAVDAAYYGTAGYAMPYVGSEMIAPVVHKAVFPKDW